MHSFQYTLNLINLTSTLHLCLHNFINIYWSHTQVHNIGHSFYFDFEAASAVVTEIFLERDDDDEEDIEYMTVPRSTKPEPTIISNPNPFSKYKTEISNELNFRRLRMKFNVKAEESEVRRWTPEIHMNLREKRWAVTRVEVEIG